MDFSVIQNAKLKISVFFAKKEGEKEDAWNIYGMLTDCLGGDGTVEEKMVMLVVDDEESERLILKQSFQEDFEIVEAENGAMALEILESQPINIVLTDISMPVMDGLALLGTMQESRKFSEIPVIAMTMYNDRDKEEKAIELGAADFLTKPVRRKLAHARVSNVLGRRENEWRRQARKAGEQEMVSMRNHIETDALTGLCNRESFYRQAGAMMRSNSEVLHDIVYFNIHKFKTINELFHRETGNSILKTAARYFQDIFGERGVCARLEADRFVICVSDEFLDMEQLFEGLNGTIKSLGINYDIQFFAGVYPVDNVFLPVSKMCDRARMALEKIRSGSNVRYVRYDEEMSRLLMEEQVILRDMERALYEKQFCIYLQPVYDLLCDSIVGAEALVRWNHPQEGMISPGHFIPVFERNGFIARLDHYVWDQVCRFLRDVKDTYGRVIPISVNISKLNFYDADLPKHLMRLIQKYHLEPWMLKLEITENAYMENRLRVISTVRALREQGFSVLLDDFGSGYSSLMMLKYLPVDMLKIDLRFAQEAAGDSERARSLLQCILHLSEELDIRIIMEGVETEQQADFFVSLGCQDFQGYYFSCPVPTDVFKALI